MQNRKCGDVTTCGVSSDTRRTWRTPSTPWPPPRMPLLAAHLAFRLGPLVGLFLGFLSRLSHCSQTKSVGQETEMKV